MANDEDVPPDRGIKFYKCHAKPPVVSVVCILCDNVYHTKEFAKFKDSRFLSEVLVICPEHRDFILDSDSSDEEENEEEFLSDTTRKVIAHLKKKLDVLNTPEKCEVAALKSENKILRAYVEDLKEKTEVQKKLLTVLEEKLEAKTYASVVKSDNKNVDHKPLEVVPSLIIKTKNGTPDPGILTNVTNKIHEKISAPIKKTFAAKNGTVIIKCKNKNDIESTKKILNEEIGNKYSVEEETMKNPRLKIVGVQNNMNLDELESDIQKRNFQGRDAQCKIIHVFQNKDRSKNVLVEVSREMYVDVTNNNRKIFIGHQSCHAYDDFNVQPCLRCGRQGHSKNKCKEPVETCFKCGGAHDITVCSSNILRCANCVYYNDKYKLDRDVSHCLNDLLNCASLKSIINRVLSTTNYPWTPILPTFLGPAGIIKLTRGKRTEDALTRV